MKKIVTLILSGIIMASTLFVGCGNNAVNKATNEEINSSETKLKSDDNKGKAGDSIKLAVYPLPSPYFEFAMEELGTFEENGANVELVYFAQYSDVIQALDSGNVDGAIVGITEVVSPIINNLGLSIIAMTDYSYGMDGIVVSSDIESLEDLKGETIATNIGTMNHMLLLDALDEAGLTAQDVTIVNMSEGDATAAFVGGSIKAASIFDPQMTTAAKEGNGKIIYSSKDQKGQLADVLLMRDDIISQRSEEVQGIINSWFSIQKKFEEDQAAVTAAIAKNTDLSDEEFLELLNGLEFAPIEYNQQIYEHEGKKLVELVENVAEFLKEADCVDSVPSEDDIKNSINGTFIENVEISK